MVVFYNDFLISHLASKPERKMTEPFFCIPSGPTEINLRCHSQHLQSGIYLIFFGKEVMLISVEILISDRC